MEQLENVNKNHMTIN